MSQFRKHPYCFPTFGQACSADSPAAGDETTVDTDQKAAYESGLADGIAQGHKIHGEQSQPLKQALIAAAQTIQDHTGTAQHTFQADVIQMAVQAANQIIKHALDGDSKPGEAVMRAAMAQAIGQENVRVRVHPAAESLAHDLVSEMQTDGDASASWSVMADRSQLPGGCLIETDRGHIDARIDKQLDAIESAFGALGSGRGQVAGDPVQTFDSLERVLAQTRPVQACGHVTQVVGLVVEANGPAVQLGSICDIYGQDGETPVAAEVLGFRDHTVLMMPLEEIRSIGPGSRVVARPTKASVEVGDALLGRVIDGLGNPIDGLGSLETDASLPIYASPINPLLRQRINQPLDMGIRSINGLLTVGCGQRIGIFAGSGVGKSVLMGMIARKSRADVNVIALIGERGRELNEFIEKELGPEGLKKSVVVVATSDHLPLVRVRGAFVATAIAEYYRDQGLQVNLMMDSLTRFAMAQREIGLALGEPPTTKGYTPSVFTLLPKLLERAGTSDHAGTITGLYTVLVEGDDLNEPIADAARSILDGHIVLSRELADQNHYPAVDVLKSISRVMEDIAGLQHKHHAGLMKEMLATYRKAEDLINIGAYVTGSNPNIDRAISKIEFINGYLRQSIQESVTFEESVEQLGQVVAQQE